MKSVKVPDNLLFYKYRSNLGENERDLKIISDQSVWFASPKDFNDPFDCVPAPSRRTTEQTIAVLKRSLSNGSIPLEHRDQIREKLDADPEGAARLVDSQTSQPEYVEKFMSPYLVYSLAKRPLNRLMWSHYANHHKGFVVEFDLQGIVEIEKDIVESDDMEDSFCPIPVNYSDERVPIHGNEYLPSAAPLYAKDVVWEYEAEHRILRQGNPRLCNFNPKYLSAIIFGAKIDSHVKSRVQDTVYEFNRDHENKINMYYAELSIDRYDLIIPNHPIHENIK